MRRRAMMCRQLVGSSGRPATVQAQKGTKGSAARRRIREEEAMHGPTMHAALDETAAQER